MSKPDGSPATDDESLPPPTICAFEVELVVGQGPSAGDRYLFQRFPVYVGRGNDVDVRLVADEDDRMLSRRHLKVSVEGGRIVVVDLSTNGTWVGDRHIPNGEPVALDGGESVWLGPRTMIMLQMVGAGLRPPVAAASPPREATEAARAIPTPTAAPPGPVPEGNVELSIEALGPVRVVAAGHELDVWPARKATVLLACLADGAPGRTLSVERLTDLLWPDSSGDARGALQATVSRLRRAFRTADPSLPDPVDLYRGGYRISLAYRVGYDSRAFELLLEEAKTSSDRASLLEQAIALYRGPFLDGYADDWVQARRRALEGQYYDAIDTLAEMRDPAVAIRLLEGVLEREPCRERSQIGLMRSLAASGRRDEALKRYHDFVRVLKKEMGLAPSPELLLAYETMKGEFTQGSH